jgi:hypothetical protein
MEPAPKSPLLSVGHEEEWAEINREEAEQLRASNMALTPAQRLEVGQGLSQQAVSLLAASIRAGHAPRRALWAPEPHESDLRNLEAIHGPLPVEPIPGLDA